MAKTYNKVLVIGSGGREHSLVKFCLDSDLAKEVIAAPGNGGMAKEVACFPVDVENPDAIADLAADQEVDFVIVGPEVPLCAGAVDKLNCRGIDCYGPNKKAAQFEGSKVFTKDFLKKYNIPTAAYGKFSDSSSAMSYLDSLEKVPVIKASGLAAGKGVFIPQTMDEAKEAVKSVMDDKIFGDSGSEVVIEEFMEGEETSFHIMVSGKYFAALPTSRDHKRAGDGDTGLNTGGMGAFAPARDIPQAIIDRVVSEIVRPTVAGFESEGIDYRGTLYIGLMLTTEGPKVVEFNVRFGDPETQVLLPLLDVDPLEVMIKCAHGEEIPEILPMKKGATAVVVLAAKGYPGSYPKGDVITEGTPPEDVQVIHAGTKMNENGDIVTNGGRVIGVTAYGDTIDIALEKAYAGVDTVTFDSKYYRTDIGKIKGVY